MSAPSGFLVLTRTSATGGFYWEQTSGTGSIVGNTSPTFVTPTLGVATATSINKVALTAPATSSTITVADGKTLTASNTLTFTGTDASSVAFGTGGTVTYTANKLSVFAATTSAELAGVISDESGTGALVFANTPTLVTPVLGVATATTINGLTINATTSGVLTIANSSTLATSGAFSITLTSTAATNVTLPTTGTLATKAGTETLTNKTLTAPIISDLSLTTDIVGTTGVAHVIRSAAGLGGVISYGMTFSTGTTVEADSGTVTIASGVVSTLGASGNVTVATGSSSTSGSTGILYLQTGNATIGNSGVISIASGAATTGNSGNAAIASGNVTTGNSGNSTITTGNATTGESGNIVLTTGTASTIRGVIFNRAASISKYQPAPATQNTAGTLTASQIINGIITVTQATAATIAITLPTGVDLANALPSSFTTSDSIDFTIINLSAAAADTATLTASVGITIVGKPIIDSANASATYPSSGTFKLRMSGAATFVAYRIS